jgi:hypothetical protein
MIFTVPAVVVDGRIRKEPETENSGERNTPSDNNPLVVLV